MREVHRSQFHLGQVPIEKIWINPKSRDDIPAVLKGLQHIWCDEALRARLVALLDEHILPEADRTVGRPGMDLWQILVLGVLKQGLGCDWVRLFFVGGRISLYGGEAGGNRNPSRRGEGAAEGTGDRWYLCRQRRLGVFRWYSRAWWRVSVRINAPAARGGLRTVATAAKCHRAPVDYHPVAGQMPTGLQ